MRGLLLQVDGDLTVRVGSSTVRLSPSQALDAAEQLVRKGMRQMMLEEAALSDAPPRPRRSARRNPH